MAYTPTNWQNLPNTTTPITANALNNMETGIKKSDTVIGGDEYDSTATYEIGDFCIYNNKLYRCTTAISTAEAWNSSHWEETSVEEELDALRKSGGIPTNSVIGYDGSTIPSGFEETDGPNDYSTTEKVIGKWIDGKPLYRKVFTGTTPNNGGVLNVPTGVSDIGTKFIEYGFVLKDANPGLNSFPYESGLWTTDIVRTDVRVMNGSSSLNNTTFYISIKYTKTTD